MKVLVDLVLNSLFDEDNDDCLYRTHLRYGAREFTQMLEQVLTASQQLACFGGNSVVFTLSKKKQKLLEQIILDQQNKKS